MKCLVSTPMTTACLVTVLYGYCFIDWSCVPARRWRELFLCRHHVRIAPTRMQVGPHQGTIWTVEVLGAFALGANFEGIAVLFVSIERRSYNLYAHVWLRTGCFCFAGWALLYAAASWRYCSTNESVASCHPSQGQSPFLGKRFATYLILNVYLLQNHREAKAPHGAKKAKKKLIPTLGSIL